MKKIVRLTESDLTRLVKRVIKEQSLMNIFRKETDPKKTDCKTNPYWKQLEPKLLSLGFTKKEEHIEKKRFFKIGGYPNIDFTECTMSHRSGIEVSYPLSMLDYTGDYYPDFVQIEGIRGISYRQPGVDNQKMFKNASCVGIPVDSDRPALKIKCVDYIYQLISFVWN